MHAASGHPLSGNSSSEQTLEAVLSCSSEAVIIQDPKGGILRWSAGAENLYGYTGAEALLMNSDTLVPPDMQAKSREVRRSVLAGARVAPYHDMRRRKDGGTITVRVCVAPLRGDQGRPIAVAFAERPLTEFDLSEYDRLKNEIETRNRVSSIILTAPEEDLYTEVLKILLEGMQSRYGVFGFLDEHGDLVVPSMTRHVWEECTVLEKRVVFPKDTWGHSSWARALREKQTFCSNEPSEKTPPGHITITRHISVPIIHRDTVVGLLQVANKTDDYTAANVKDLELIGRMIAPVLDARLRRDQYDRQLFASLEKTRIVLDNIKIGVAMISPDLKVLEMNRCLREWFPESGECALPECYRIFNEPSRESGCGDCPVLKTVSDGLVHEATRKLSRNGGTMICRMITSPVLNERKEVTAVIALIEDITRQRSLEDQLRQAQKMEAIGQLAGGVAHDFNNMLSIIIGYTEMLIDKTAPVDPLRGDAAEILNAAQRSRDLTQQLLAFARRQPIMPLVVNLNAVVERSRKMLARLIGEDVALVFDPAPDLWPVNVDLSQVDQILANLAINARDAINGVGSLIVETSNIEFDEEYCRDHSGFNPGQYVLLSVSDTGTGMDSQTMQNVFEPFFTTKGKGRGTGLGLSTVYGIVKQNNGFINVYSEPGQGSTFKIYLPRHEGEAVAMAAPPIETDYTETETVLVVEDEEQILKLCRKMLERLGYRVLTAGSPDEAVFQVESRKEPVHLLITDIVLPSMNGKELWERLENIKPGLRVLYMSGYTANVIAHRGVIARDVNFIQKPFTTKDLARKAREALK